MNQSLAKRIEALEAESAGHNLHIVEAKGRTDDDVKAEVARIEAEGKRNGFEPLILIISDRRNRGQPLPTCPEVSGVVAQP